MSSQPKTAKVAKSHSSLITIPDITQCILIPDEQGVHHAHPVMKSRISQVKTLVGPAINTAALVTPNTTLGQMGSFGSTASSVYSSASSVGSHGSAVTQSR